jgi:4-hydroxymandelate oxidase
MTRRNFLAAVGASALTGAPKSGSLASPEALPSPLGDMLNLDDFEAAARKTLHTSVFAYVSSGAADEITLGWNRERYRELRLMPRALIDVSRVDCSTVLLGHPMPTPILFAPVSNQRLVHPDGELATARGAGLTGTTMVLSSGANTSIEDVVGVAKAPVFFQLYVAKDRGLARALIQRVQEAGAKALVVTIDSPVDGLRNRQDRDKLVIPPGISYPHYVGITEPASTVTLDVVSPAQLDWKDIEWIRTLCKVPMLLKGVINPDDAERGIRAGADGLIVSNHGARCLDTQPATIEALPRVVEKVAGRVPVLVDGGIRRGTDIVKAIAYGAAAVLIGRPYVFGLAAGGEQGVAHVLKLLRQELLLSMATLGRPTLASIDRTVLWT